MSALFEAEAYTVETPGPRRFLVTLGTVVEVITAASADAAREKVIARRFPTRGSGSMAARTLPPDAAEMRVREVTDDELAAYGITK